MRVGDVWIQFMSRKPLPRVGTILRLRAPSGKIGRKPDMSEREQSTMFGTSRYGGQVSDYRDVPHRYYIVRCVYADSKEFHYQLLSSHKTLALAYRALQRYG